MPALWPIPPTSPQASSPSCANTRPCAPPSPIMSLSRTNAYSPVPLKSPTCSDLSNQAREIIQGVVSQVLTDSQKNKSLMSPSPKSDITSPTFSSLISPTVQPLSPPSRTQMMSPNYRIHNTSSSSIKCTEESDDRSTSPKPTTGMMQTLMFSPTIATQSPTSSPKSKVNHVVARMTKVNQEYKARKLAAQQKQLQEEMKQMRSPKINKSPSNSSSSICSSDNRFGVVDRLHLYGKEMESRRALLRTMLEGYNVSPHKPHINAKSKTLQRTCDHLLKWKQEKEARLQKMLEQKNLEDKHVHSPSISSTSEALIAKSRPTTIPVEQRLYQAGQEKKARQQHLQEMVAMEEIHRQNPQQADPYLYERLYKEAVHLKERKDESERITEFLISSGIDPNTGEQLGTPRITEHAHRMTTDEAVHLRLLRYGSQYLRKKERRALQELRNEARAHNVALHTASQRSTCSSPRSTASPMSAIPSSPRPFNMGSPKSSVASPRLSLLNTPKKSKINGSSPKSNIPPQPTASPKSKEHRNNEQNGSRFVERSEIWHRRLERKLERERRDKNEKDTAECTFRPCLNINSPLKETRRNIINDKRSRSTSVPTKSETRSSRSEEESSPRSERSNSMSPVFDEKVYEDKKYKILGTIFKTDKQNPVGDNEIQAQEPESSDWSYDLSEVSSTSSEVDEITFEEAKSIDPFEEGTYQWEREMLLRRIYQAQLQIAEERGRMMLLDTNGESTKKS